MTAQRSHKAAEQPTIIYDESGFPVGEAVLQELAAPFHSPGKCVHELGLLDTEGYAARLERVRH